MLNYRFNNLVNVKHVQVCHQDSLHTTVKTGVLPSETGEAKMFLFSPKTPQLNDNIVCVVESGLKLPLISI